jgi:hypothetical protein
MMKRLFSQDQTLAEYCLLFAALAVVVYVGYAAMGGQIGSLLGIVDSQL